MLKFKAKKRTAKNNKDIRDNGSLPAVVYGHGVETQSIEIDYQGFRKILETVGESTLIELDIENDESITVLIHDIQYNPVNDSVIHVDFYQIKKGEKINIDIEFNFIGEAPAVRELGGILVKSHDKVPVRCLPKDLISHLDVDLSVLKTFDDVIRIEDLNVPETLEVLGEDMVIASVSMPKKEEEVEALDKEVKLPEIVGAKKDKEDGAKAEDKKS